LPKSGRTEKIVFNRHFFNRQKSCLIVKKIVFNRHFTKLR
jgi:hypothetical protein